MNILTNLRAPAATCSPQEICGICCKTWLRIYNYIIIVVPEFSKLQQLVLT